MKEEVKTPWGMKEGDRFLLLVSDYKGSYIRGNAYLKYNETGIMLRRAFQSRGKKGPYKPIGNRFYPYTSIIVYGPAEKL